MPVNHGVDLYIYDLSQGIAKALAPILLKANIEGIWHTGVVIYGREYFYGSNGIQYVEPGGTILGHTYKIMKMGTTEVTIDIFEDYLRGLASDTFMASKYHVLDHNCNTFSNTVTTFLLDKKIPQHILDLPKTIENSQLGMMLRPVLQNLSQGHRIIPAQGTSLSNEASRSEPSRVPSKEVDVDETTRFESTVSQKDDDSRADLKNESSQSVPTSQLTALLTPLFENLAKSFNPPTLHKEETNRTPKGAFNSKSHKGNNTKQQRDDSDKRAKAANGKINQTSHPSKTHHTPSTSTKNHQNSQLSSLLTPLLDTLAKSIDTFPPNKAMNKTKKHDKTISEKSNTNNFQKDHKDDNKKRHHDDDDNKYHKDDNKHHKDNETQQKDDEKQQKDDDNYKKKSFNSKNNKNSNNDVTAGGSGSGENWGNDDGGKNCVIWGAYGGGESNQKVVERGLKIEKLLKETLQKYDLENAMQES